MSLVNQFYNLPDSSLLGRVHFIVVVKKLKGKTYLINTTDPNGAKFEYDWLCLNYMNNISDIILQSSKNTRVDKGLHVYPFNDILSKYGYSIISKPRCSVVYSTSPTTVNFESPLFQDPIHHVIYSKTNGPSNIPVIVSENFDIDFMKSKICELFPDINAEPTVTIECGAIFFKILLELKQYPDYLLFTELEGRDERDDYLVGEIDMELVGENYRLISESEKFEDEWGKWTFKVYSKNS
ncbi:hypothetical protein SteCoe_4203 [Stentor coeruleus]|uniref:Uncharacterized protein n=1 Tax=Stentor coeruleus TaxID=5963 RepID=A0A1R2CVH5_9CILI|nr:hypothetical protein SteCoe_4203 [Stentor coeruleus]